MKNFLRLSMLSLLSLFSTAAIAGTETITFSELGYENQTELSTVAGTCCTLTFSVGTGSTKPAYYTSGTAARLYGGNTLTISSDSTITNIAFTYTSSSNAPTSDKSSVDTGTYDYDAHAWTGATQSITLTNTASSGHFKIQSITITYSSDGTTNDDSTNDGTDDGTTEDGSNGDGTTGDTTDDSTGDEGGSTSTAAGSGTLEDPYNVVAAIEYTTALGSNVTSTDKIYIKGIISSIKYTYNENYGTGTFYISDDGTDTNTFYVYSAYYLNNAAWTSSDTQIAVGDTVVIYGNVVYYNGTTPETSSKSAYIYSLNGNTGSSSEEGGDGDDSTDDGSTDGDTTTETTNVTFDFTTDPAYDMAATSDSNTYLTSDTTIVSDGVSLTLSGKYRLWSGSSVDLRIYKESTVKLSVASGSTITGITFTGSKLTNQTADSGTYDSGTWTGNAQSVTFSQSSTVQYSTIVVSYAEANDSTITDDDSTDGTEEGGTEGEGTEESVEIYKTYVKATTIESGKEYLLVAQRDEMTYYAYPLSSSYTFGYMYTGAVSGYNDTLQISADYEDGFVITETDGQYSIMDVANSKYYYHTGSYNSFNAQTADTVAWTIAVQDDGTYMITASDGYYIQWGSGSYTTFCVYTTAQDGTVLPYLYEYVSTDTISTDSESTEDDTTTGYKTYVKTSTVEAGKEYLLVAQRDEMTYYAYPASSSSNYGYLSSGSISGYVDTINVSTSYEDGFIIDTYDDGYSIKDVSTDRYYYQNSTYASFQISATDPGSVWYIDLQSDGTFKIEMNTYFIQWGQSTYTTFGLYTSEQEGAVYPYLYVLYEDEDEETGIESISVSRTLDASKPIYNLAGQRVSINTKGILIQNGRKFLNK